ncbi:hypothetical protein [Rosenbergiella collisarenosi]|uniref:hypothetical protein n=1 Tax=Rosenbergiella collisarenosi TaxID=1544695 RepID=UPI001F4E31D6|nr:hypothetical protein [Rosenbergiella collisarenosi]
MKKILIAFLFSISLPTFAADSGFRPIKFSCEGHDFTLFLGNAGVAVVRDDELMSDSSIVDKPYGDIQDASILTFDHWGANGGMHVHYNAVFDGSWKIKKVSSVYLDADNAQRDDPNILKCKQ